MIRAAAIVSALFLAVPAFAAKKKPAKASGLWLNTADLSHSIEFPAGWPYPGKSQSVSPPGMTHLFFLATADDALAVDIAAATPMMSPEKYFEIAAAVGAAGKPEKTKLSDKSAFEYRRSVEKQGAQSQYFTQGVLVKKDGRYYVTVTSPRRHPGKKEWAAILGALASLRNASSTALGLIAPEKKGAVVVNIGPDGSTLRLVPPWENQSWGYTKRLGTPLHSFKRGPLRCELAHLGQAKASPSALAGGLRARYYESSRQKPGPKESELSSKKLKNGVELAYFEIGLPARDDDPRKQWLLEGFFARGGELYYYLAAAAQDDLPKPAFEKAAADSLDVLGEIDFRK